MDGSSPTPIRSAFHELDHAPVPVAWLPDLSATILVLREKISVIDQEILRSLTALLVRYGPQLQIDAAKSARVERPTGVTTSHPGSSTLFAMRQGRTGGLSLLISIGLNGLIEAGPHGMREPAELLTLLRGAMETENSPITGAVGAITSIPELVRIITTDPPTRDALPKRFVALWDRWLRDRLLHWMLSDPLQLRRRLEPTDLRPNLEDHVLPVAISDDVESSMSFTCRNTPAIESETGVSAAIRLGRAESDRLERASIGDLLAPAALRIPAFLDERLCREVVRRASVLVHENSTDAEQFVALALLLAGGLREIDLQEVSWGTESDARPFALDPIRPVLYRRVRRPANAVAPTFDDGLRPCAEVLAWPIPASVHRLLHQLSGDVPTTGRPALPILAGSVASPYRMHAVMAQVVPEAKVGALAPRVAVASEIARSLGTEVAQLAFGETFGMSAVPAYYSSLPESELSSCIAEIQSRRFGEAVPTPAGRDGYIGSRLTLTDTMATRWPSLLRDALTRASRRSSDWLAQWVAHRDHLVGALCSATGHRPEDALGRIHLGDVIPEYGLVVLQDKQSDALRTARIAALGRLWVSDLRRYLDRLIEIAKMKDTPAAKLAEGILRNEQSLFSIPDSEGAIVRMTSASLRKSMPPELKSVANFYRHRLNQALLRRRIDPELRHAQLGWVVAQAHLHSNLSPRSPIDLAGALESPIDDLLIADGWYPPSSRKTRWTWDGVPMPPAVDWKSVLDTHARRHQEEIVRIRQQMRDRWKEREPQVLSRLATALQEFCPLLRLDGTTKRLEPLSDAIKPIALSADQHGLICDRVRQGDVEPISGLEAVMARILLYRIVRRARSTGVVSGPIPSRPYLTATSEPAPFVPALGIAVRHTLALRGALEDRAKAGRARELGQLTAWSVVAFSIYRRLDWARAATGGASTALRGRGRDSTVRMAPGVNGAVINMVFSGVPAALLVRRALDAPTALAPSPVVMERWAASNLLECLDWPAEPGVAECIEATLSAAARIELSGIERHLVKSGMEMSAAAPSRCVARDDDWPIRTTPKLQEEAPGREPPFVERTAPDAVPSTRRPGYLQLMSLLNRRSYGRLRAERKKARSKNSREERQASDGKFGWRGALIGDLTELRSQQRGDENLYLLISYALDHLRHGSEAGNQLSHGSLQREISTLGWPLLALSGELNLLALGSDELRVLYREILYSKSSAGRPYVLEEIRRFHRYLVRVHSRPSVDLSELASLAGTRTATRNPGLLTRAEIAATDEVLQCDYALEAARSDASPSFLRLANLRRVYYLILGASGIRPGSAYGLTLGDLHLSDAGDYVHVHTTGRYGEAKTRASVGFFKLNGAMWAQSRGWLGEWIATERSLNPDRWLDTPLFASAPGHRTRVHERYLAARVDEVLKWATGDRTASCYWLRKTEVSEKFHRLARTDDLSARDVYGAVVASGHAGIEVTIDRYINDAACLVINQLRALDTATRSAFLSFSGVRAGAVDMAWSRSKNVSRTGVVLERLGSDCLPRPQEVRTPPPPIRRFTQFLPAHVDRYARQMHRWRDQAEAAVAAGITDAQAAAADSALCTLYTQRGLTLWPFFGRKAVAPPRRIRGTEKWFSLLDDMPSSGLLELAERWAAQPFAEKHFGPGVQMLVEDCSLAFVRRLFEETGLKVQINPHEGRYLLEIPQISGNEKSHAPALRWVLSMIWIYSRLEGGSRGIGAANN